MYKTMIALAAAGLAAAGALLWLAGSPATPPPAAADESFPFAALDRPQPLPEVRFTDGTGQTLSLADFHGKVVLLNLWATWCLPCQEEMPSLDRLQAQLGGAQFEVVALSVDQGGIDEVAPFYQENGITSLRMFVDPSGETPLTLNVFGIPTTLLIDRQGREVGRSFGIAAWDSPAALALIRRHLDNAP
ncbi:MAG: TlpA family protein disulfide reductase [Pseudomonadota bacterium]|nr:TlpA family protein disulfide reductase [Pseudomonadota bacterium]